MTSFLSINDRSRSELEKILTAAKRYYEQGEDIRPSITSDGKILVNLFFENSTRTCTSFELAAKRLGMKVVNVNVGSSSVHKGESLMDTVLAISAMRPSVVVVRSGYANLLNVVKSKISCHVINAGDGINEHPSQAMQDLFLINEKFGRNCNLRIAICGDFFHSRVAHSSILLFKKFHCKVSIVSTRTILDTTYSLWLKKNFDIDVFYDVESGIRGSDVVMALRTQGERMSGCYISSTTEYYKSFGISSKKMYMAPKSRLLHPGPVNRDLEVSSLLVDDAKKSFISNQIFSGICVRQSIIKDVID